MSRRDHRIGPHLWSRAEDPTPRFDIDTEEGRAALERWRRERAERSAFATALGLLEGELAEAVAAERANAILEGAGREVHELHAAVERRSEYEGGMPYVAGGCFVVLRRLLGTLELPPVAKVAVALAYEAGFEAGRMFEVERQAREITTGIKVREGGCKGAAIVNPPDEDTAERLAAWRGALEAVRRPDGELPHGAVARVARTLAKRYGTTPEAERRFFYNRRAVGDL